MEMISGAILNILEGGRRAVIPGLGAFLRKTGEDKIVFVEFLKRDDGVLAGLLMEQYGLSAREAQEAIGGFVGDLQRMVATPEGFLVEGLGVMRIDANGVLDLEYGARHTAHGTRGGLFEAENEQSALNVIPSERSDEESSEYDDKAFDSSTNSPLEEEQMVFEIAAEPEEEPAATFPVSPEAAAVSGFRSPVSETEVTDLRYEKPVQQVKPPRKRRADTIMIVAIAAAVLAIAAMVFGALTERRTRLPEFEEPTEQVADSTLS